MIKIIKIWKYLHPKNGGMSKILNNNAKFEMFQFDHDKKLSYVVNLEESWQCSKWSKIQRRD